MCLRVERIKLKDPAQYLEPFISVSVKGWLPIFPRAPDYADSDGNDMCPTQDTPVASSKDEFVHFNQDVYLQIPHENIGKGV